MFVLSEEEGGDLRGPRERGSPPLPLLAIVFSRSAEKRFFSSPLIYTNVDAGAAAAPEV